MKQSPMADLLSQRQPVASAQHENMRPFKLKPENMYVKFKVQPIHMRSAKVECMIQMTQFQVNLNNVTTGHKLQGIPKDTLLISSFPNKALRALIKN